MWRIQHITRIGVNRTIPPPPAIDKSSVERLAVSYSIFSYQSDAALVVLNFIFKRAILNLITFRIFMIVSYVCIWIVQILYSLLTGLAQLLSLYNICIKKGKL